MLPVIHVQRLGCLFAVVLGLAAVQSARGQCETQKIVPADGAAGDQFGTSVDVSGDSIIVGTPLHNGTIGAAYVYVRQNGQWVEQAKLTDAQVLPGDDFGRSVSIADDAVAIGAPKADRGSATDVGRVFMYRRNGTNWITETISTPQFILAGSEFGTSASVDGDAVLVGVPKSDDVNNMPLGLGNTGSAFVFRRDSVTGSWNQEATLVASDATETDQFGFTVLLRGNTAFVAAFGDKDPNISAANTIGSVYVFTRQNNVWTQTQKLVPSDITPANPPSGAQNFGRTLGTDGTRLIAGERQAGSAYIYQFNGTMWVEEAIIKRPATSPAQDQFGSSVAINGDFALVGSQLDDDNSTSNSGTVFAYHRTGSTWTLQPLFYGSQAVVNGRLGSSLASRGTYAVVGAIQPALTGATFVLAVQPVPDCNGDSQQDECQLNSNPGLDGNQNGILDACECQNDNDCNDNVTCTSNICNTTLGECTFPVQTGFCLIGGACIADGTINPANECQVCSATALSNGWSNKADDTACTDDTNECTKDVCIAGACSHPGEPPTKACGSNNNTVCDKPDTCSGDGVCLNNFPGQSVSCDDAMACNGSQEFCNSMGTCVALSPPPCDNEPVKTKCIEITGGHMCTQCFTVADCPDDGNVCTIESCNTVAGLCVSTNAPTGTGCGDPTVTDCDLADTCNATGVCQQNRKANNALCTSDGNACNGTERCQTGACVSNNVNPCAANVNAPNCVVGGTPDMFTCATCTSDNQCNDNNACTADTCTAGACLFTPLPVGTNCGPVDQTVDTCNLQDTCNGQGACLQNLAPNGTVCPDADLCNGTEKCLNGVCGDGPDPCLAPLVCDPIDGSCKCTADAQCTDGLFCNGSEVCNIPGGNTVGTCGPAADTTPCNQPTTPDCDEATDSCRCSTNAQCSDGAFCTGTETCVSGACVATGNPCTSLGLTCNEGADRCDCNDNGDCNQTLYCAPQVCTNGQCAAGPARCPAGQQCDERNDRCATCLSSDDAICDDDNDCTLDTCPVGQCVHTPISGCNDSDRDGVPNNRDRCAGTSPGAEVDANGCADFQRDTDDDGVNDDVDDCPATPEEERENVDRNGCAESQIDSDADGVVDADDDCPDSPEGAGVDDNGCADVERDDDADGVLNGDDRCADTPADTVVDIEGCADSQRDTDGDGVADGTDTCPGTADGVEVDETGCPVEEPDNGNDNGNNNGNDNGNDNGNEPGQEVPGDGLGLCGAAGFIGWFSLFTGFAAMRLTRRRR